MFVDSLTQLSSTSSAFSGGFSFDQFLQSELNAVTGTDIKQVGKFDGILFTFNVI